MAALVQFAPPSIGGGQTLSSCPRTDIPVSSAASTDSQWDVITDTVCKRLEERQARRTSSQGLTKTQWNDLTVSLCNEFERRQAETKQAQLEQMMGEFYERERLEGESLRLSKESAEEVLHAGESWYKTDDDIWLSIATLQANKDNQDNHAIKHIPLSTSEGTRNAALITLLDGHGYSALTEDAREKLNDTLQKSIQHAYLTAEDGRPSSGCVESAMSQA